MQIDSLFSEVQKQTGNINNLFNCDLPIDSDIYQAQKVSVSGLKKNNENYIESVYFNNPYNDYNVSANMTIFDITMTAYGDINHLFDTLNKSNIKLDDDLSQGYVIKLQTNNKGNNIIKNKFIKFANKGGDNVTNHEVINLLRTFDYTFDITFF